MTRKCSALMKAKRLYRPDEEGEVGTVELEVETQLSTRGSQSKAECTTATLT